MKKRTALSIGMLALSISFSQAQSDKQKVISTLQGKTDYYGAISKKIWDYAEVGYQETKSSALLQDELKKAGFSIQSGVAGIPTAFIATYGSGKPVISILAEYDALPGLAQEATPERKIIEGQRAGHACGHHLFGTGSSAAAIAVKDWLKQSGKTGTIKLIGTPAEEGGSGKVYMVRDGIFNDTDVVLHWHPGDANAANPSSSLANISGKFRFKGISAHAAAAPERGRSSLDGVEAMNDMVNMMREHIPQETRIHYIITKGGEAPNVVPDFAEVYYYARHKDRSILQNVWKRITKAAEGAALGTETQMELEVIGGVYNLLSVDALSSIMHKNLETVGGFTYTPTEQQFADKISETFGASFGSLPKRGTAQQIAPYSAASLLGSASTDVGDVSWVVPTVGLTTATWVPGTAAHSWQAVAAGGTSIGVKGMMVAAKTIALTAIDLYNDPSLVKKAKEEWQELRGENFKYEALLGNRKPALDYRK